MSLIDEIEKINDRVAIGIGQETRQTMNIATLEEKTREMQIKKDFPNLFSHQEYVSTDQTNNSINVKKPLTQQLSEAYQASDLKAYYSRDLDNFNLMLKRSNGSLKSMNLAYVNSESW